MLLLNDLDLQILFQLFHLNSQRILMFSHIFEFHEITVSAYRKSWLWSEDTWTQTPTEETSFTYADSLDEAKSLANKWNWTEHYKIHSREKPFDCKACGACFSQKGSLLKHIKAKGTINDDHGLQAFMANYKTKCKDEESP